MPTFQATGDGSSQYAELNPGIYEARVIKAEAAYSKSTNNEMIRLYLRVFAPNGATEIRENLVFTAKAFWKIEQFWRATGHDFNQGTALCIEARDCYGLTCWVRTDQRPGTKNPDVLFPYVEDFMRSDETPYKGEDPKYTPQNHQQKAEPHQDRHGWTQRGNSYYPPNGRIQTPAVPTMEDDDIPF